LSTLRYQTAMDFKAAAEVLLGTEPVTAIDIAERLGKDPHTIRRARMSGPNARSAPKGWEAVVADLAEKHADELTERVSRLRALVRELRRS
jgi:predicted transcriptional regulator